MEPAEGSSVPRRILVIDDEEPVRLVIGGVLRQAGYEVQCAADGRSGLELSKTQNFDLLITDLFMPERDGLETIMALRRGHAPLKIIAISGFVQTLGEDYLKIARHLGADLTLSKPFSRTELMEAVEKLLGSPAGPAS